MRSSDTSPCRLEQPRGLWSVRDSKSQILDEYEKWINFGPGIPLEQDILMIIHPTTPR